MMGAWPDCRAVVVIVDIVAVVPICVCLGESRGMRATGGKC